MSVCPMSFLFFREFFYEVNDIFKTLSVIAHFSCEFICCLLVMMAMQMFCFLCLHTVWVEVEWGCAVH